MSKGIVFLSKDQARTIDRTNRMPLASIALTRLFPGLQGQAKPHASTTPSNPYLHNEAWLQSQKAELAAAIKDIEQNG